MSLVSKYEQLIIPRPGDQPTLLTSETTITLLFWKAPIANRLTDGLLRKLGLLA
jgi:hypothetical protein